MMNQIRAWVSTGAAGAWHPPKFWTSSLAPADFEVLNTNWHPQSTFYLIGGTLRFKFLTQALNRVVKIQIILQKGFYPIVFLKGLLYKGRKTKQKLKYKHLNSDPLSVMISVEVNFCKFSPIPAVVQSTDPLSTTELGPILLSYISFRYWNPFVSSVKHAYSMYHFTLRI